MSERTKQKRITIFFCYAREDETLLNQLKNHLQPLQRQGLIELWYDREIRAGSEWEPEINRKLDTAQIILLLVSPDFMASDYCYGIEMKRALKRHQRGEATVIPIILRDVFWHGEPLGRLQALPTNGRPVTDQGWGSRDAAFYTIVVGIRDAVEAQLAEAEQQRQTEEVKRRQAEEKTHRVEEERIRKAKEEEAERVRRRGEVDASQPPLASQTIQSSTEMATLLPEILLPQPTMGETSADLLTQLQVLKTEEEGSQAEKERTRQEQEQAEKLETEMARSSKLPPLRVKRVKRSSSRRIVLVGLAGLVIVALIRGVVWFTAHQTPLTRGIQASLAGRSTSGANATTAVQATSGIPGKTWHTQIVGPPDSLSSVAWSGSQFVVVGDKGAILTSPDGHTWTAQNSGTTNELNDVVWSDSQFVVVGDGTILTSLDGHTWTVQKSDIADVLDGVAWSGKQFVVDSFSGTILTSPDGHTWTVQNSGTTEILDGVAWSGKQFVVVGENGIILTSPDGHTWTLQNSGASLDLSGVAWSGKQFVVVDDGGDVLTSPDGHTWRSQSSGVTNWLGDVAWSGSQFIVVGATGTILTSPDGHTWAAQHSGTTNALNAVAWSGSRFVVVGATGTILTSP